MQNYPAPIIELEREGYELRLYETLDGFLLYHGDYVINTWLKCFETLAEALAYCALIDVDAGCDGVTPHALKETAQELLSRSESE